MSGMKKESELISVIVPVYNTAKYLPQCLDSLLKQTYPHIEILCVDDGSTDNSWDVLQEYAAKDNRVKVFHQENAGVSVARNKALDHATGEWLSFIDSDDWLDLDTYQIVVKNFSNDIDVVYFGVKMEPHFSNKEQLSYDFNYLPEYEGIGDIDASFILSRAGVVSNKVMRRCLVESYGIRFFEGISQGEDGAFCLCYMSVARKVYGVKRHLYHYYRRESSATGKKYHKIPSSIDSLKAIVLVYHFISLHKDCVSNLMKKLYPFLFWIYYDVAKQYIPDSLEDYVKSEALRHSNELGLYPIEKCNGYLSVLQAELSPTERIFHWYRRNCECFGFFGKSIWSITYCPTIKVHRFMGKILFRTSYRSLK